MRHLVSGRKLGVDSSHRIAMMRSLTLALIEKETIQTTPARAKELRWYAERIVTLAKRGDVASRRRMVQLLGSNETSVPGKNRVRTAIARVYENLAPRFKDRPGGYTQIIRLATRRAGDNAEQCLMRYIPQLEEKKEKKEAKAAGGAKKKTKAAPSDKVEAKSKKKKETAE